MIADLLKYAVPYRGIAPKWLTPNPRRKHKSGLAYYARDPQKKHWHRIKGPWDGRYIWVRRSYTMPLPEAPDAG